MLINYQVWLCPCGIKRRIKEIIKMYVHQLSGSRVLGTLIIRIQKCVVQALQRMLKWHADY